MRISLCTVSYLCLSDVGCPYSGIREEETLLRSKSINNRECGIFCGILERMIRDLQPSMVCQILSKCETAVRIQVRQHLD